MEIVAGCVCADCTDERTDWGTGGITGRASCASSELTTPRLGARTLGTVREAIATELGGLGGVFPVEVEFCKSCFNRTFCVSSDLLCVDEVGSGGFIESSALSIGSSLTVDTSRLCRLRPRIGAGDSLGTSSIDFDLRKAEVSWECSSWLALLPGLLIGVIDEEVDILVEG